jgi:hypothetical protein
MINGTCPFISTRHHASSSTLTFSPSLSYLLRIIHANFDRPTRPSTHSGIIVEKLLEYMTFKSHYENLSAKEEVPVTDFLERIPPELVLELYVLRPFLFFLVLMLSY